MTTPAKPVQPITIKLKMVPDREPNHDGVFITYVHRKAKPTRAELVKNPPWHWLDSLCGIGYHCVSYQLQGK